jgi:L-arabinokinase
LIVFYTSGHGFGHASRDIEIVNALGRLASSAGVHVRTSAARWLFDLTTTTPIEFTTVECDTGIVQIDSLRLDADESIRRADAFHAELDERAAREAAFLRSVGARVVVGDIPPLAFAAAARAGVPSIALGNFTWDWIYAGYPEQLASAPSLLPRIWKAYAQADVALRLPMHGGFEAFRRVEDVPFVTRHARRSREDVRNALCLPHDLALVLVSFGGYGLEKLDLRRVSDALDIGLVATTAYPHAPLVDRHGHRLWTVGEIDLYRCGFRYEDLVHAVDVVATKPGYGIIAECIANDTAMLYTSRGQFVEYDVMVEEMPRYLRSAFISNDDLAAGRWAPALERLFAQPALPERPRTDGADLVARRILEYLG